MLPLTTTDDIGYISDSNGNTTAVIVPIQVWRDMKREITPEQNDSTPQKRAFPTSLEGIHGTRKYTKIFADFSGEQVMVRLHYPVQCEIEENNEGVLISYQPLNVHGCGSTEQAAVADIAQEFQYLYHYSQQQEDAHLTEYAKKMKYGALLLIKETLHGKP
jgi:hypothetical protein